MDRQYLPKNLKIL